jgi:hypothetical protein
VNALGALSSTDRGQRKALHDDSRRHPADGGTEWRDGRWAIQVGGKRSAA